MTEQKTERAMERCGDGRPAIQCRGITKVFGSVVANDQIDLSVNYGEIMALLGENGSGKTTLMNMLSGIYHPDSGTILIGGKEAVIHSPIDSRKFGIGMIHQHFKLVDVFSAMDNIVLGTEEKRLKPKVLKEKILTISRSFGLEIEPEKRICDMSVSEKQTVEILKVLYRGAQILILDEPTAVLTPQETDKLFAILGRMKEQGCAIIIITHKLNEVLAVSDRVTILRKGKSIETVQTKTCSEKMLTELMVGRPVDLDIDRPMTENRKSILKVVDLTVENQDGSIALDDISFEIRSGEILGVAGVAGSGQKELCEVITGLLAAKKGAVLYHKENIIGKTPAEIIKLGISMSFVPEDRLGMGLVASMGMVDNMLLKSYGSARGPFVDRKPARELAEKLVKELGIVTPGVDMPVRMMSGGNVQKVLLGREIESSPQVLITAYPVRGLDINSSYTIYNLLNEQKKRGVAVIYIGEDLDVLLELSDRIMVLCHGQVTGIAAAESLTKEQVGLMMTGAALADVTGEDVGFRPGDGSGSEGDDAKGSGRRDRTERERAAAKGTERGDRAEKERAAAKGSGWGDRAEKERAAAKGTERGDRAERERTAAKGTERGDRAESVESVLGDREVKS